MMRQSEKTSVMPVAFIADELKKLWDLKQAGALTEDEFAQLKVRLLCEQTTIETNPEQPAIVANPEQPAVEANPEQPAIEANAEQPKPELAGAPVYVPDSQGREVDAPETLAQPEPVSPPTPSPKVDSRRLVKCPECGAPTFDLARHRHLPFFIPDRSYKLPIDDSEPVMTEDKGNSGKTVTDVIEAPQPTLTSIPVPEQIVAPLQGVKKAKVGVGRLIFKIVFWVVAFLCVLFIIASMRSNSPSPANPETKPATTSSS